MCEFKHDSNSTTADLMPSGEMFIVYGTCVCLIVRFVQLSSAALNVFGTCDGKDVRLVYVCTFISKDLD